MKRRFVWIFSYLLTIRIIFDTLKGAFNRNKPTNSNQYTNKCKRNEAKRSYSVYIYES